MTETALQRRMSRIPWNYGASSPWGNRPVSAGLVYLISSRGVDLRRPSGVALMVMSEEGGNLGYDRRIRNSDRDALTFAGCGEPSGKLFAPVGWFTLRRIVFRSVTGAHVASPDTAGDRVTQAIASYVAVFDHPVGRG